MHKTVLCRYMVDIINYDSLVPPLYYHTWLTPNGEIYLCYPANNLLHSWPRPPLSSATPGHRPCMLYIILPRHQYFSEPNIYFCVHNKVYLNFYWCATAHCCYCSLNWSSEVPARAATQLSTFILQEHKNL